MAKLLGFAELSEVDPRIVFLAADAGLDYGGDHIPAALHIARRRGKVAVAFECDSEAPGAWTLIGLGPRELAARPVVSDRNGLTIIGSVQLIQATHAEPPTCWRSGHDPKHLDDYRRQWWAHVVVPPRANTLPLPIEGRPHGIGEPARLTIAGPIGTGRYNGGEIADQVRAVRHKTIHLTIDSEGGDTRDGMTIYRALAAHPHMVEVDIVGRAESMACVIAMAGDIRRIAVDGRMMLHQTQIPTPHNASASDLRRIAGDMEQMHRDFAGIVASATGCGLAIAEAWIDAETRFNAGQAVMGGLAHAILDDLPPQLARQPRARFAGIAGPYRSVRPAGAPAALYAHGGRYKAGQQVRHNGKVYVATCATFGAPGLEPGRNTSDWEMIRG